MRAYGSSSCWTRGTTRKELVSIALADNVESLTLTGTSPIDGTGNALNNVLTGNAAANVLYGGDGDDILNGGGAGDMLVGGAGNDTYIVDSEDDLIVEYEDAGTDTAKASVSYVLEGITSRTSHSPATRQSRAAAIHWTTRSSATPPPMLLYGRDGNDTLNGKGGADYLAGGAGESSVYVVDESDVTIVENADEGIDTVKSAIDCLLGAHAGESDAYRRCGPELFRQ